MAVQVNVTMAQPDGMDTLVWPCWVSPCSGPPCCNPERASSPALACAPHCKKEHHTAWQLQAQLTMAQPDGMGYLGVAVLGVAVLGTAVLGTAVLQPGARIQPGPGLRPSL